MNENLKYQMVSIGSMNEQINIRLSDELINSARMYAKKHGFGNVQELIKESLRAKVFGDTTISHRELELVQKLAALTKKKNLYGTEQQLFAKLQGKE